MDNLRFEEYIAFLREHFINLVEYHDCRGNPHPELNQVEADLFNEDPFVVYGASLIATAALADDKIYH